MINGPGLNSLIVDESGKNNDVRGSGSPTRDPQWRA